MIGLNESFQRFMGSDDSAIGKAALFVRYYLDIDKTVKIVLGQ